MSDHLAAERKVKRSHWATRGGGGGSALLLLRLREAKKEGAAPAGFISDSQEQRAVLKQSLPLSSLHLGLQWGYHMEKMDGGVL